MRPGVEVLEDVYPELGAKDLTTLHVLLRAAFKLRLAKLKYSNEQMDQLLAAEMSLGTLTDLISYTLDVELDVKVQLLSDVNVVRRARRLIAWLEAHDVPLVPESPPNFPPDFSLN